MACDEVADLIGSCEASLDMLGLLIGDIKEEVQDRAGSWPTAEMLNHLLDTERRYGVAHAGRADHHRLLDPPPGWHDAIHAGQIARRLSGRSS